jgi:hypothetical protein
MPITTTTCIIIALAGQADEAVSPSPQFLVNQTIHLWELPPTGSGAFALRVAEGDNTREIQLSDAESEQLVTLLGQLPAHSMVSDGMSFDGITYELTVMQAEQTLSFHWRNNDWRYAPQSPLDKWERVAAVAAYALNLTKKE